MAYVLFDEYRPTDTFSPRIEDLQVARITQPDGLLKAAYGLFERVFDRAVLDTYEVYKDLVTPSGLCIDDFPAILIAAFLPHHNDRLVVGFLSSNLMWTDGTHQSTQLAIGNVATSPAIIQRGVGGIGSLLWKTAIDCARTEAVARHVPLEYSVAEAEASSLGFWKKLGYLRPSGLRYLQPPLSFDSAGDPECKEVGESLLICPFIANDRESIDAAKLRRMIEAIYRNWSILPNSRGASKKARRKIEDYVLKEVYPRVDRTFPKGSTVKLVAPFEFSDYRPVGVFEHVSVVFHFVYVPKKLTSGTSFRSGAFEPDLYLDSIERDLLACGYRDPVDRPFQTRVVSVPQRFQQVELTFPKNLAYDAEGHIVAHANRQARTCNVTAFVTTFRRNQIAVLSVAFNPDSSCGGSFDELDVIALSKFWEGGEGTAQGEPFNLASEIQAKWRPNSEKVEIHKLAELLHDEALKFAPKDTNDASEFRPPVLAGGTIQIVSPQSRTRGDNAISWDWDAFDLSKASPQNKTSHLRMALKGMATGLLDIGHDFVDFQELKDSLRRFKVMFSEPDSKEYAAANKSTLLVFNKDCRLYRDFKHLVGANPYLWLAHVVCIYNETVLRSAILSFNEVDSNKQAQTEATYQKAQDDMRERLQTDRLLDVFHYPHEKELYEQCAETRGLAELYDRAQLRLERVAGDLQETREVRNQKITAAISVLGLVVTVVSILGNYSAIHDFVHKAPMDYAISALVVSLVAVVVTAILSSRRVMRHSQSDDRLSKIVLVLSTLALTLGLLFVWAWVGPDMKSDNPTAKTTKLSEPPAAK